jgi:hypothetical protein
MTARLRPEPATVVKVWGEGERHARCQTCGKEWNAPNALGVAGTHVRTHGHTVVIRTVASATWRPGEPS